MAKLAVRGGKPVRTKPFPAWPIVGKEELKAVNEVVKSGRWGHLMTPKNSKVEEFRGKFAKYYGVEYAIPVTNGSVALEVPLRNAGIGYGDEVIVPPTTWVAPNLAPVMVGADPVFVDIAPDTYCLDADKIEKAITPQTKAIIAVHIAGYCCEMDKIMALARKYKLVVIEDCAQAHGSRYHGKLTGTFGHFGNFSFEISKLMTAGEGGMVITGDKALAYNIFGLCGEAGNQPQKIFSKNRRNVGWNTRITEMQAAILICQLRRLEAHKKKRIENAEYLKKRLLEIEGIKPLKQSLEQNYYSYLFKYDSRSFKGATKQKFMEALTAEGIPLFSSPSHQLPAYRAGQFYSPRRDYSKVYCPVAEKAFNEEAIGLRATWMLLGNKKDMDDIVDSIIKIKENVEEIVS